MYRKVKRGVTIEKPVLFLQQFSENIEIKFSLFDFKIAVNLSKAISARRRALLTDSLTIRQSSWIKITRDVEQQLRQGLVKYIVIVGIMREIETLRIWRYKE